MRAIWVDMGNDPDWDLLRRHNMNWVFLSLLEPDLWNRLVRIRDRGFAAGVYAAWGWGGLQGTGTGFARNVDAVLRAKVPFATPLFPRVMLNDETHDPDRISSLLQEWRRLRPRTATSWTLEGMQGGWFTPQLVQTIKDTKVRVVPQAYTGPMVPTCPLAAVRDITRRGVPDSMVSPFYDATTANTPFQDGFFFTQGRLP